MLPLGIIAVTRQRVANAALLEQLSVAAEKLNELTRASEFEKLRRTLLTVAADINSSDARLEMLRQTQAKLDREKALSAFKATIADPLGMEVIEAAGQVYRLTNSMIYDLLHRLTIERGLDPRVYALFAYGGTAGMHVTAFAREMGVTRVIMPHSASVHGAFGLVTADVTHEEQVTRPLKVPVAPETVNDIFAALSAKVEHKLESEGFETRDRLISRAIDMRYRRQVHVVTTPVESAGPLSEADVEATVEAFNRMYEERFGKGSGYKEAGIELVNFRVRGVGSLRKPEIRGRDLGPADPSPAFVERRRAYFSAAQGLVEASCYDFEKLSPGNEITGPAIVWTPITTIAVNPGQTAWCDVYKNLHVMF